MMNVTVKQGGAGRTSVTIYSGRMTVAVAICGHFERPTAITMAFRVLKAEGTWSPTFLATMLMVALNMLPSTPLGIAADMAEELGMTEEARFLRQ